VLLGVLALLLALALARAARRNWLKDLAMLDSCLEFFGLGKDGPEIMLERTHSLLAVERTHHLVVLVGQARGASAAEDGRDDIGRKHLRTTSRSSLGRHDEDQDDDEEEEGKVSRSLLLG